MSTFDDWLDRKLAEPPQPHVIILSRFARSQEVIPQEKLDAIVAAMKEDSGLSVAEFARSIGVEFSYIADDGVTVMDGEDFTQVREAAAKADMFECGYCGHWLSNVEASVDDPEVCDECMEDEIGEDEDIDDDMDDDDDEYDEYDDDEDDFGDDDDDDLDDEDD